MLPTRRQPAVSRKRANSNNDPVPPEQGQLDNTDMDDEVWSHGGGGGCWDVNHNTSAWVIALVTQMILSFYVEKNR